MDGRHDHVSRARVITGLGVIGIGLVAICAAAVGMRAYRPPAEKSSIPKAAQARDRPQRPAEEESRFVEARRWMVEEQLRGRDITDAGVLRAMGRVPRQRFVPKDWQGLAYVDHALPIDRQQTISQPYIVALMTQEARPTSRSRALEIGTGSGYQAAVLAELCKEVYSVEILKPLADSARQRLAALGYKNITIRHGDGYQGWREHAPFDLIVVTAAADHVPQPLVEQLAVGGRMVIPLGSYSQELVLLEKQQDGTTSRKAIVPVMFVPMTGEAQKKPKP
jgi:protein-L-isoaspartate(D-aspartate) O-methyltransferase